MEEPRLQSENVLSNKKPEKRLLLSFKNRAGRSSSGRITIRHRGGGAKKLYRIVDFGQNKINIPGKVVALEYDPYRTSYIALVEYQDGEKRYVLASKGLKAGDQIICADNAELKGGNRAKLKNIPVGTQVYNVELDPGRGGKIAKGAGASVTVLAQEAPFTHLEMPSGEIRKVWQECFATLGTVSNEKHMYEILGKAGRRRWMGFRPTVRGSAMNTPDHPHGGGRGKAGAGMKYPKTPWGKQARGVQTRKEGKTDRFILKRRQVKSK